jgi:hypothetical protein
VLAIAVHDGEHISARGIPAGDCGRGEPLGAGAAQQPDTCIDFGMSEHDGSGSVVSGIVNDDDLMGHLVQHAAKLAQNRADRFGFVERTNHH